MNSWKISIGNSIYNVKLLSQITLEGKVLDCHLDVIDKQLLISKKLSVLDRIDMVARLAAWAWMTDTGKADADHANDVAELCGQIARQLVQSGMMHPATSFDVNGL